MALYKNKFRVESARLKDWDYSTPWWYYITICTKNMKCWIGIVKHSRMMLNVCGKIVEEEWLLTRSIRSNVDLDYYVVMPNHFHGILIIESVETSRRDVLKKDTPIFSNSETAQQAVSTTLKPNSLSSIIGQFKSVVTKRIRKNGRTNFGWQPGFYDHIIRNENDLHRIRTYIQNNPLK
jgi:REP-associated tyrosine transposase